MAGFLTLWSKTAADNDDADASINWAEGQAPGSVNNSARALMAAVASWRDDINGSLSTGGSSNAYTIASPNISYASLSTGLIVGFKANHANTGAATLNLNSLGAKAIRTQGDEALSVGMILSNGHYMARYDTALNGGAGAWALLNPSPITQPIGGMIEYAGTTAPTGWLLCYGQAISRTTYAALFAAISTTHGSGDGSTTFNVPDCRGRIGVGTDNMGGSAANRVTSAGSGVNGVSLGATGGAQTVTLSSSEMPAHTHTGATGNEAGHTHAISITSGAGSAHSHGISIISDPGSAHTHSVSGTTGTESQSHTHSLDTNRLFKNFTAGSSTTDTFLADDSGSANIGTSAAASVTHTHSFAVTSAAESSHTHVVSGTSATEGSHTHSVSGTSGAGSSHSHTFLSDSTGGGGAHNNMPPVIVVNKIIYAGV